MYYDKCCDNKIFTRWWIYRMNGQTAARRRADGAIKN